MQLQLQPVQFPCTVTHTSWYYCGFTFNEINAKRRLSGERETSVWQISYVLEENKCLTLSVVLYPKNTRNCFEGRARLQGV